MKATRLSRLPEAPEVFPAVRPDRRGEEHDTVTCEPHYGFRERLGVRPDRTPGKLGVAVGGQVRSDLLDDFGRLSSGTNSPEAKAMGK